MPHCEDEKCEEMDKCVWTTHEKLLLELDAEEWRSVISSFDLPRVGMESFKNDLV